MLHSWETQNCGVLSSCCEERERDEIMVQGTDLKNKKFGAQGDHASFDEPFIVCFDQEMVLNWLCG